MTNHPDISPSSELTFLTFYISGGKRRESSSADSDGDQASLHGPHGQGEDPQAGDNGEAAV